MTTEPLTYTERRQLDKAVAEVLGRKVEGDGTGTLDYMEYDERGSSYRLPRYSDGPVALAALYSFQRQNGGEIEIVLQETDGEHKWAVTQAHTEWHEGPTLWLAICRFIVGNRELEHRPSVAQR